MGRRRDRVRAARLLGAVLCLLTAASPAESQVFRWVDERGTVHFTQGLDSVPERYRASAQPLQLAPAPSPSPEPSPARPPEKPPETRPTTPTPVHEPPARASKPVKPVPEPRQPTPSSAAPTPPQADRYRFRPSTEARRIEVKVPAQFVRLSSAQIVDYPDAVTTILSVMAHQLRLPRVDHVKIVLYPTTEMFEAGLRTELKVSGSAARESARFSQATAGRRILLINEERLNRMKKDRWLRLLAHELTHVVENEIGQRTDAWISEGFANFVAYHVIQALGLNTFARQREEQRVLLARSASRQTFPQLRDLDRGGRFAMLRNQYGHAATYGQSFFAVEYLIHRNGLSKLLEFMWAMEHSSDRLGNFRAVFGQDFERFESDFADHLRGLVRY